MAGLLGIMPGEWDGDIGSQRMQYGLLGLAGLSSMFENQGPRYTTNLAEATTPRQNTFMQSLPSQMIAIQREQRQRQRDEMMNRLYGTQIKKAEREDAARERFSQSLPPTMDPAQRAYADINPEKVYESQYGGVMSGPALEQKRQLDAEKRAADMAQWQAQQVLPQAAVDQKIQMQQAGQVLPDAAVRQRMMMSQQQPMTDAALQQQLALTEGKAKAAAMAKEPPKLDTSGRKELGELGGIASRFDTLNGTFDDKFAGYRSDAIGEFALKAGRNVPGAPGAASSDATNWWQGYQEHKNLVRNKLFGSALTTTERDEFDKAQITPGMNSDLVRKNLARQDAAAKKAAQKLAQSYLADGYKPEAVEAALGYRLNDLNPKTDLKSKYGLE